MLVLGDTICRYKILPSSSSIFSIKYVGAKIPFVAKEEYAEAISIGVAAPAPKVREITGSNSELIPILCAVEANFSPPSSDASCANTVFIDLLVASSKDTIPDVSSNLIDLLYSALS